jgi:hypothetical protein
MEMETGLDFSKHFRRKTVHPPPLKHLIQIEYSNEKIKMTLNTDFLDVHQYIKEISNL